MTFYVIDDHPLMREAMVMLLRRLRPGAEVVEVSHLGKFAAAVKAHGEPDLICLDLKLPDTLGVSGIREVRAGYPHTPLAVISSELAAHSEDPCIEAGADIYIEKSAGATEISAALKTPAHRRERAGPGGSRRNADQALQAAEAADPHARPGPEQPRYRRKARHQRAHGEGSPLAPVQAHRGQQPHPDAALRAGQRLADQLTARILRDRAGPTPGPLGQQVVRSISGRPAGNRRPPGGPLADSAGCAVPPGSARCSPSGDP
jgi:DNA-binding NarL/FixJ family response regulator